MGVIGGKAVKGAGKLTRFVASKLKTKLAEKRMAKMVKGAQNVSDRPNLKSAANAERNKVELRREMGRPHVEDPKLAKILKEFHRTEENCIGSGSTAASARHEILTGELVKGKSHIQKSQDGMRYLEKWLRNNPTARPGDRAAAENMLKDLRDALNTTK
jgi:hypothetical protein